MNIDQQIILMEKAISIQNEKQSIQNLFRDVDWQYVLDEHEKLDKQYESVLRELSESVLVNQ